LDNKTIVSYAAICFGVVLILIGATFAAMYVLEAVIGTAGEPDRSLIFWYLPVLFIGFALAGSGLGLCRWGLKRLKTSN
jgi:hypothetical protein